MPIANTRNRGSAVVELVVLTPVLIMLTLFVVYLGRAGGATQQVRHAADEAARAASIVSRARMAAVAQSVAARDLVDNGANCESTTVAVEINDAAGSSSVTVSVSCAISTAGATLLGVGSRTINASSTEVIDEHRGS